MINLPHETALLVIEQLALLDGAEPSVDSAHLATAVRLKLACDDWMRCRGGAGAKMALVDLLARVVAKSAPIGAIPEDVSEDPRTMIIRAKEAERLPFKEDEDGRDREECLAASVRYQRSNPHLSALWQLAFLAFLGNPAVGARDYGHALFTTCVDLAAFPEILQALSVESRRRSL